MHTSPYRPGAQCSRSVVVPLRRPTDDTLALANAAADGMRYMYVPGFRFIKAGVILVDLQPASLLQRELDLEPEETLCQWRSQFPQFGRSKFPHLWFVG